MRADGLERIGEGREAEIFLQDDGTVLKLMRSASDSAKTRIARETTVLRALAVAGPAVPAVVATTTTAGRPGLVTTRVNGANLLEELGRRPVSIVTAAHALARAHLSVHEHQAPSSLPGLNAVLREQIPASDSLPTRLQGRVLAILDALPQGRTLCHGDLHLGNLLGTWDDPVVIDWGDATQGDPVADVAYTDLMHRLGDPPPGSPTLIRSLAFVGGKVLAHQYLSAYRRSRAVDRAVLQRWRIVRAAARLSADIPAERSRLLKFLDRSIDR